MTCVNIATPLAKVKKKKDLAQNAVPNITETANYRTVNYSEAAKLLGIGRNSVARLVSSGKLTVVPVGGRRKIPIRSIELFTRPTNV